MPPSHRSNLIHNHWPGTNPDTDTLAQSLGGCIVLVLLTVAIPLGQSAAFAQQSGAGPGAVDHNFPAVPRETAQLFSRFREAVQEQRFGDAAVSLEQTLLALGEDDFFVFDSRSRLATGFRSEISRAIANLDPAIAERFEQRCGGEAQRMLDEALATHDERKLEACAHK